MKRTKIICTLGPSTDNLDTLVGLINEGMDVARLNFSHGNKEERDARIALIRQARERTGRHIPIMLDTKGIKIRTGYVQGYSETNKKATISLTKGKTVTFVCSLKQEPSTPERIYIDYEALPSEIAAGQRILLDDGLVATKVAAIKGNEITATVLNSGSIVSRRSVNLPGVKLSIEFLTEQDKQDLLYGISKDVDFVALSFVRRHEDVAKARKFLDDNGGSRIMIISKIENVEGVENLDEILTLSDGVMVARGDMAVELPFERVPLIQKQMIAKSLAKRKIVVTATQMLHSMIKDPTPTRAEVSDIFTAVQDMTTCIMLSGETASGDYPLEAVRTMATIAGSSEEASQYKERFFGRQFDFSGHVTTSICHAAVSTAYHVRAKAIFAYSESGLTVRRLSALRPGIPIIALSNDEKVLRQCHMLWGVEPAYCASLPNAEELYTHALQFADHALEDGDNIVVVAGSTVGVSGSTNAIRVVTKGNVVLRGVAMDNARARGTVRVCKDLDEAATLQAGDVAVLYRLHEGFLPHLGSIAALLLANAEYDEEVMRALIARDIPIIIDVQGVAQRVSNGMVVDVDGRKGVVLLPEKA